MQQVADFDLLSLTVLSFIIWLAVLFDGCKSRHHVILHPLNALKQSWGHGPPDSKSICFGYPQ